MVFSSSVFLFIFLPVVLLVDHVISPKYKNTWLFACSFVFYAWGGVQYAIIVLVLSAVNWLMGLAMEVPPSMAPERAKATRKRMLLISLLANFGTLGFFKYFNFFVDNIESVIHIFSPEFSFHAPNIPLPIGISFFTFQIASYTIDLYREQVKVQRSFINLSLYVLLFPQLIAGPIVRYIDVEAQIKDRSVDMGKFALGVERFIFGFSKKILLANTSGRIADTIINSPGYWSTPACWFGIVCYSFQIYFDFAGYSDMAIGLGKMLGFDFLENFNYPYVSSSMQEFWRRWHISLSSWFRDYLYIPLGGNRKGTFTTYRNLLIVFFVTGLWHGASWNFVVWGLWHGAFLILERLFLGKFLKRIPAFFGHIYTIIAVVIGWALFRIEDLQTALRFIKYMFVPAMTNWTYHITLLDQEAVVFLVLCAVMSIGFFPKLKEILEKRRIGSSVMARGSYYATLLAVFAISVLYMTGSSFNPFIYFRF